MIENKAIFKKIIVKFVRLMNEFSEQTINAIIGGAVKAGFKTILRL